MRPEERAPGGAGGNHDGMGRCPICRKRATRDYRPFCSKRCADVDLGRWLKGSYRIADDRPDGPLATDEDENFG